MHRHNWGVFSVYISSMKNAIKVALGLALGLSIFTATAVSAEPVSRPLNFSTQMTPSFPVADYAGAYLGTLRLTFGSDGTVSGWYRAQDAGPVQAVVGGLTGQRIWFDIGNEPLLPAANAFGRGGTLQVTGTLENGRIVGSVQDGSSWLKFVAQQET